MDFSILNDLLNINSLDDLENKYKKLVIDNYNDMEYINIIYEYIKDNYRDYNIDDIDKRVCIDSLYLVKRCLMLGFDYLVVRVEYEYYLLDTGNDIDFSTYLDKFIYIKALSYKLGIDIDWLNSKFLYFDDKIKYLEDKNNYSFKSK